MKEPADDKNSRLAQLKAMRLSQAFFGVILLLLSYQLVMLFTVFRDSKNFSVLLTYKLIVFAVMAVGFCLSRLAIVKSRE
jgi:putative flippase GtrA